jgi:hypothetical protein
MGNSTFLAVSLMTDAENYKVKEVALRKLLSGAGIAVVVKVVTGFAVAALAATAAGAATEAAITGSLNPTDWGKQVVQQVATCKADLATGEHGIGACVSAFAKQHGKLVSAEHHASGNGNANGHGANKGNSNGNGNGNGHGQTSHKPDSTPEDVSTDGGGG